MNKYFKKFGIMFVMALILSLGFCISAFADDAGVAGVTNLDGTTGITQNSAKVGDQLKLPEVGWKRYDDTNSNINYDENWATVNNATRYKGALHYTTHKGASVSFKFYGTKLRYICENWTGYANNVSIKIDDLPTQYINQGSSTSGVAECVVFQQLNLTPGIHNVVVTMPNDGNWTYGWLDAIDIDNDGYLINPNESISLDQSSIDITEGDTQQLTATTTPAGAQVTWSSSDDSIATVDSTGKVTAIGAGTAAITATTTDGSNLSASCTVTVTPKGTEPSNPTDPTGDANLYIELVDGQIKQYTVSSDEINKFTDWYENRDNDHSLPATYKFTKGSYTDYVVQSQIDWFEVR